MKITRIDIQNFRKLKECKIEVSEQKTVFVGANNSGKTSAMDALMAFLKTKEIVTEDFTICNWKNINEITKSWITEEDCDLTKSIWRNYVPTLDVWISVSENELHYVSHLLPTLDWDTGELGVRLILEPKKVENLFKEFKEAYEKARATESKRGEKSTLSLWPQSMQDFLAKRTEKKNFISSYFDINAFLLDPSKKDEEQMVDEMAEPLSGNPFKGLIKIDVINAQRGFSDPHSGEGQANNDKRLSSQFRDYFQKHLDPEEQPEESDLSALEAMENARSEFDTRIKESFKESIGELENLSYPGFSDPQIHITSKVNPIDGLNHSAAVQFNVFKDGGEAATDISMTLPEKYNGLGYQNLISMIFNLIRYRDEWMRVGKATKPTDTTHIEPLHIVLVEEPEAHLHAQVQQVFIRKAYEVLRKHPLLEGEDSSFTTQLLLSTHSSHIAHEIDFRSLRYFKRQKAISATDVPYATVANLSKVFGEEEETGKFATRYLKSTHCDLFFADAAILVEGPAERMLVPHFIKGNFPELYKSYVSLLEIGGSHAHKLKPLIDTLQIPTLVITDLDSVEEKAPTSASGRVTFPSVQPQKGQSYLTGNSSVKEWAPKKKDLDEVLSASEEDKIVDDFVRIAYQYEVDLTYNDADVSAIPYTFEDALVLANVEYFKGLSSSTGLLKKMYNAVSETTIDGATTKMFEALGKSAKKAEMALELLWETEPEELTTPPYVVEGLEWLQTLLIDKKKEFVSTPEIAEVEE